MIVRMPPDGVVNVAAKPPCGSAATVVWSSIGCCASVTSNARTRVRAESADGDGAAAGEIHIERAVVGAKKMLIRQTRFRAGR